ncbi:MAG: 3-phosphoserine/phosphohydroxythreonine transaminase [Clostridia bacterium]
MAVYNFSAGPSMFAEEVKLQVQKDFLNYDNSGISIVEMSHRSKWYSEIHAEANALFRELLNIGDDYYVLFLQGGASSQFEAVALNLLNNTKKADYIVTGNFSNKAFQAASRYGDVVAVASSKADNYTYIPDVDKVQYRDNTDYVHITTNNTIFGTHYTKFPKVNNLVGDMSSNIMGEVMDVSKFNLIYAGAQKNMAPSGLTIVAVKKNLVGHAQDICPIMLNYQTQAPADSLYNTPTTFSTYMAMLTFRWLKKFGGVAEIEKQNKYKASMLYNLIDNSKLYKNNIEVNSRSIMNVPFVTTSKELDAKFVKEAEENGIISIKGHKVVGGMRASIYNGMPVEGVKYLAEFMKKFELQNK